MVSIEGVITTEPPSTPFAGSAVNVEGVQLVRALGGSEYTIFVTGSTDREGVEHWMQAHLGTTANIEYPMFVDASAESWERRLSVLRRLTRSYRGVLTVVDASPFIKSALQPLGVTVLQPHFGKNRAVVDENELMPLRAISQSWGES